MLLPWLDLRRPQPVSYTHLDVYKRQTVTSARLLAAKKTGPQAWEVATQTGAVKMLPFIAIGEEQYSTYLRVG